MNPLALLSNIAFKMIGIAGIGFLIGFHELGHFLFCKLFNIKTPSFSIGFGPRLISKKIGDTVFTLSAIPLGGYVEIAGAAEVGQGEQQNSDSNDENSFARKPYYQKMAVMVGGILFNLIFAYITFIALFATGIPKNGILYPQNATPIIESVKKDSAAALSGLQAGDVIIAFNPHETNAPEQNSTNIDNNILTLLSYIKSHPQQPVTLTIQRDNNKHNITVMPNAQKIGWPIGTVGTLNVIFERKAIPSHSISDAIKMGIAETNRFIINTVLSLKSLFSQGVNEMAGPIMIISMASEKAATSMKMFFLLLAVISINLAVLNLIPLPIFDGGQILFYSIEALIGRPLPNRVREYIHIATWLMLLILIVYISFKDITRLASPQIEAALQFVGLRK